MRNNTAYFNIYQLIKNRNDRATARQGAVNRAPNNVNGTSVTYMYNPLTAPCGHVIHALYSPRPACAAPDLRRTALATTEPRDFILPTEPPPRWQCKSARLQTACEGFKRAGTLCFKQERRRGLRAGWTPVVLTPAHHIRMALWLSVCARC